MSVDILDGIELQPPSGTATETARPVEAPDAPVSYLDRIRAMHQGASECGELREFGLALVRALAWIIFACESPDVTGEILHRLGSNIEEFAARDRAQRELEDLKKAGGQTS